MKRLQIDTLEKGFAAEDKLLLHASFQILVNYWNELIKLGNNEDPDSDEIYLNIKALYNWWTKERLIAYQELNNDFDSLEKLDNESGFVYFFNNIKKYNKLFKREDELYDIDTAKLQELIKLRPYLW